MRQGRNQAVLCCDPALAVLIMFGVSKRLSRSISLAVYCLYIFFCLIRSFVRSYTLYAILRQCLSYEVSSSFSCLIFFFRAVFLRGTHDGQKEFTRSSPKGSLSLRIGLDLQSVDRTQQQCSDEHDNKTRTNFMVLELHMREYRGACDFDVTGLV